MALFDQIGKKLTEVSQTTVQKTKEVADIAKFTNLIGEEKKILELNYQNLGQAYFDKYKDSPDQDFKDLTTSKKDSLQKIEEYDKELESLKGIQKCGNCGGEINPTDPFCSHCGSKVEPIIKRVQCPSYKAEISSSSKFCTSCGEALNISEEDIAVDVDKE